MQLPPKKHLQRWTAFQDLLAPGLFKYSLSAPSLGWDWPTALIARKRAELGLVSGCRRKVEPFLTCTSSEVRILNPFD